MTGRRFKKNHLPANYNHPFKQLMREISTELGRKPADAAKILGIPYAGLLGILNADHLPTQQWVDKKGIFIALKAEKPEVYNRFEARINEAYAELADGRKDKKSSDKAVLNNNDKWRLEVGSSISSYINKRGDSVDDIAPFTKSAALKRNWDKVMAGDPALPVSVFEDGLREIFSIYMLGSIKGSHTDPALIRMQNQLLEAPARVYSRPINPKLL